MVLEMRRTVLRPFVEADALDVFAYAGDPRVGPAAGWRPHAGLEETRRILGTLREADSVFAVVDRETGRVIGSARFVAKANGVTSNEIGFALHPDWWGRGIMTEVCRELVRYGFTALGFSEIWAMCYRENARCRALLERCGFQFVFEQTLTDEFAQERPVCCYILLRAGWKEGTDGN